MKCTVNRFRYIAAGLLVGLSLASSPLTLAAHAQSASSITQGSAVLSEVTIKALQEALNKQGISVKADGVMNDETRNAVRKYQSQHHLPVTGEADKATLDKLGVAAPAGALPGSAATTGQTPQAPSGSAASSQMPSQSGQGASGMMSGPMMQGMMQGMMQTMQGMMGMMQRQTSSGEAKSESETRPDERSSGMMRSPPMQGKMQGPMQRGGMQAPSGRSETGCPMTEGSAQSGPAMMQMMQGMMQMMQMMQSQMQPAQRP